METKNLSNPSLGSDRNRISSFVRAILTLVTAYMLTSILFRMLSDRRYSLALMIAVSALFLLTLVFALIHGARLRVSSVIALLLGWSAGAFAWLNGEQFFSQYLYLHVLVLSYTFFTLSLFGNANRTLSGGPFLLDAIKATFVYPFLSFVSIFLSLFQWKRSAKRSGRVVLFTLIGIAAALLLGIAAIALLSFDPRFAELFRIDWDWDQLPETIAKAILCVPLAALLFGAFTSSEQKKLPNMSTPETAAKIGTRMKKVHPVIFLIPTGVLLVIYGLFFFTQWDVYMSAFSGVLPSSYTAAEYARSGFFELCAVAAINALLGIVMTLFMNESSRAAGILKRIANTLLALATLILIATALSKMVLYIRRFDLTVLRLLTSVILLLIGIGFLVSVLSQWIRKIKTAPVLIVIVAALLLAAPFLNVNGRIAQYNVDAYLARAEQNMPDNKIDIYYLDYDLGDAAIPEMLRLYQSGAFPQEKERKLLELLSADYTRLSGYKPLDHSLQSKKALDALESIKDDLN